MTGGGKSKKVTNIIVVVHLFTRQYLISGDELQALLTWTVEAPHNLSNSEGQFRLRQLKNIPHGDTEVTVSFPKQQMETKTTHITPKNMAPN